MKWPCVLLAATCLWPHLASARTVLLTYSSGTGFFVSSKGYVLTNNHVLKDCSEITLHNADGDIDAALVARDVKHDLALLRTHSGLRGVANLSSDKQPVRAGDPVLIIGYPGQSFQTGNSVIRHAQVISAKSEQGGDQWLEITDALAQGNSGGPLVDSAGNVVGVATAKARSYTYNEIEKREEDVRNFDVAITLPVVRAFLDANGITYNEADSGIYYSDAHLIDQAQRFIVNVRCRYGEERVIEP